jgi:hypothetical protein
VRDRGAVNDTDRLQVDPSITEVLEEPYTTAKERGHQVDLDLVEEPGTQAVLRNARPPADSRPCHPLVTRCCLRLVDGALYAVGDERGRRLAVWGSSAASFAAAMNPSSAMLRGAITFGIGSVSSFSRCGMDHLWRPRPPMRAQGAAHP